MTVERARAIRQVCWKCREPTGGPVCSSCGAIQPPRPGTDLYALLGLERVYFIDTAEMERSYRALSRKVHPDRFARRPAVERRMSLQWTAALNEARRVLKDPIRRARYLATGRAEAPEQGGPVMEPDFLEQVFELQMAASAEPDTVAAVAAKMRDAEWAGIEAVLRAWEAAGASSEGLEDLEERLARLKYIDNIVALAAAGG